MSFTYPMVPSVAFVQVGAAAADAALIAWGHYLHEQGRPFGREDWALLLDGEPIAVACSASIISNSVAGYKRGEVVELARLCRRPEAEFSWATLPTLRLWRQVAAPRWHYWPVKAAVAYSQNKRHNGGIYRMDGWESLNAHCGVSRGGGTWTRQRQEGDPEVGAKTLWIWRYA